MATQNLSQSGKDHVDELNLRILAMTDVGKYSLIHLYVTLFCNINEVQTDIDWSKIYVSKLVDQIGLPSSVASSFTLMLEEDLHQSEEDERLEPLIDVLRAEPGLCEDISVALQELIRLSVNQGGYDARARVIIFLVGDKLGVVEDTIASYEESLANSMTVVIENNTKDHEEADKRKTWRQRKKAFLIGLGVVTGGAIIGLTGGLAAPIVAASAGALIGGSGATFLASSAGLALITSVFGATGAGLTGHKMSRRVGMTEEFEFIALSDVRRLHLTICVSGWLLDDETDGFTTQWSVLSPSLESYSLKWESKYLLELGSAIRHIVRSNVIGAAASEALKYTVFQGLMAAIAWPVTLLNAASLIDNPWSVCASRAKEVGRELARVLLSREQGQRPVTLMGFSLGARVVYYCLDELSEHGDSGGIIQDAILLGAPVNGKVERWKKFSGVVAGKVVNGYCRKDWLLRFVYRASSMRASIAGLTAIPWMNRKMTNVDLTEVINGHMDYADPENLRTIFEIIGVKTDGERLRGCVGKKVPKDDFKNSSDVHCVVSDILDEQIDIAVATAASRETAT